METKMKAIVLGASLQGISASKLLIKKEIEALLFDNNPKVNIDIIKKEIYGKTKFSVKTDTVLDNELDDIKLCIICKDYPKKSLIYEKILKRKIPVISTLELGYLNYDGEICAVTGTNGKTMVTDLVYKILSKKFESDSVLANDNTKNFCERILNDTCGKKMILECSSAELEFTMTFKPKFAAILNISPDHLDRHDTYTDYINAKISIAKNMTQDDTLVLNYEDTLIRNLSVTKNIFDCKKVFYSSKRILAEGFYLNDDSIFYRDSVKTIKLFKTSELKIFGAHNFDNVMASMALAYLSGVGLADIVDVVKEYRGLEHSLELVREKNGVKYYNDAASTNPDSTIAALNSLSGKIILIAGGRDKNTDMGDLIMQIKEHVKYLILIGENKRKIAYKCHDFNYNNVIYADSLDESIDIANSYSNIGDNVLFSPACGYLDMFKDTGDRGNKYKEKVMSIK